MCYRQYQTISVSVSSMDQIQKRYCIFNLLMVLYRHGLRSTNIQ